MAEQYANNAKTTLNGAINNSTTSITVTDGSVFPSSGDYRLKVDDELMICTARSGNTLTVTRGAESTTASSHSDLAQISLVLTTQSFLNLLGEGMQFGPRASRPTAPRKGTRYIPDDYGLESIYDGSAWRSIASGRIVTPPVVSNFTWVNQGSATASDRDGIVMSVPDSSNDQIRLLVASTPGSSYTLRVAVRGLLGLGNFYGYGIGVRESSSGKIITFMAKQDGTVATDRWHAANSFLNNLAATSSNISSTRVPDLHLSIVRNGTNRLYQLSVNGYDWITHATTSNTDHLTEDQVALLVFTNRAGASATAVQAHFLHYSLS